MRENILTCPECKHKEVDTGRWNCPKCTVVVRNGRPDARGWSCACCKLADARYCFHDCNCCNNMICAQCINFTRTDIRSITNYCVTCVPLSGEKLINYQAETEKNRQDGVYFKP